MSRPETVALAGAIAALAAGAAAAQSPVVVALGETKAGVIADADPAYPDGKRYDLYMLSGTPGQRVMVTLRASAFDPMMTASALLTEGQCNALLRTAPCLVDDDSGGALNARIVTTIHPSGYLWVAAQPVSPRGRGAYEIAFEPAPPGLAETPPRPSAPRPPAPAPAPGPAGAAAAPPPPASQTTTAEAPIRIGQTLSGVLAPTDGRRSGGAFADTFVLAAPPGARFDVSLTAAFDTLLEVGLDAGGLCLPADGCVTDDDGGDGLNSLVRGFVAPASGQVRIRAASAFAGRTGTYNLAVTAVGAAAPVAFRPEPPDTPITVGATVSGMLSPSDRMRPGPEYYDTYRLTAAPGTRIDVDMRAAYTSHLSVGIGLDDGCAGACVARSGGPGQPARVIGFVVGASGETRIKAGALMRDTTGSYALVVRATPPPPPVAALNTVFAQWPAARPDTRGTMVTQNGQTYLIAHNGGGRLAVPVNYARLLQGRDAIMMATPDRLRDCAVVSTAPVGALAEREAKAAQTQRTFSMLAEPFLAGLEPPAGETLLSREMHVLPAPPGATAPSFRGPLLLFGFRSDRTNQAMVRAILTVADHWSGGVTFGCDAPDTPADRAAVLQILRTGAQLLAAP